MPEPHQGYAQFYKPFWGLHDKPDGGKFNNLQTPLVDTTKDFGDPRKGSVGFWESIIVETSPLRVTNQTYLHKNLWWPPEHPRMVLHQNEKWPHYDAKSWPKSCSYGIINRDADAKNDKGPSATWTLSSIGQDEYGYHKPTEYLALPIPHKGFKPGDHLWLDCIRPIRAIYIPSWFEESKQYASYGMYIKLDLLHLDENHLITPDITCPKGFRRLGVGAGWKEIGEEGLLSYTHTLVIDVFKYVTLATIPYDLRTSDPMTAVHYTKADHVQQNGSSILPQEGRGWPHAGGPMWFYMSVSYSEVMSFEARKKIKEDHPPEVSYLARALQGVGFVGSFIPLVGPVLSTGLDVVRKQLQTGEKPDMAALLGIEKASWDVLDQHTKDDITSQVWRLLKSFKGLIKP